MPGVCRRMITGSKTHFLNGSSRNNYSICPWGAWHFKKQSRVLEVFVVLSIVLFVLFAKLGLHFVACEL